MWRKSQRLLVIASSKIIDSLAGDADQKAGEWIHSEIIP
jgi:hypothetical protein